MPAPNSGSIGIALPLGALRAEVESALSREVRGRIPVDAESENAVEKALREASLSPGKRVRPVLMLLVGDLFRVPHRRVLRLSVIVELLHAASLVLDDLPCMDDADTRRGRPSLHREFGEATAILAAFSLLSATHTLLPAACRDARIPRRRRAEIHAELDGVVGALCRGQDLDLLGKARTVEELERVHAEKTGSLFVLSARWGAYAGRPSAGERRQVEAYARNLGLAFQVMDDVLDVCGDPGRLGKPVGQDSGRTTFVDLLGVPGARRLAGELAATAVEALHPFRGRGVALERLARELVSRER